MASLLPSTILPYTEPIGQVMQDGSVQIDKNWWLLIYNLCINILGTSQTGLPADALQDLFSADLDAIDSDAVALRRPIANLAVELEDPLKISASELPEIFRNYLLAQDALLPDAPTWPQPIASIVPTGSVFTYTASYPGTVVIQGGTVSVIALVRQKTSVTTGLTDGVIPMSRYDQVQVTYVSAPTMSFIPWSSM
jgi:hypothetical protein